MSEGKIDETLAENGDREDEDTNGLLESDGEIFDDDEPEEQKRVSISFSQTKPRKNFRSRQENSDDEQDGKVPLTFSGYYFQSPTKCTHISFQSTKRKKSLTRN